MVNYETPMQSDVPYVVIRQTEVVWLWLDLQFGGYQTVFVTLPKFAGDDLTVLWSMTCTEIDSLYL